jgi:hypothetical protein
MSYGVDNTIVEILLWNVKFSNENEVALSFIVTTTKTLQWGVASVGTSISPVQFFSCYDDAMIEMHRRCGILALSGKTIVSNERYGEIRGFYNAQPSSIITVHETPNAMNTSNPSNPFNPPKQKTSAGSSSTGVHSKKTDILKF